MQARCEALHAGDAAGGDGGGGGGGGSHAGLAPRRTCRRGRPARGPTRPGSLAAAPPRPQRPSHGFQRGKFGSGGAQGVSRGKSGQSCSIRHNHRRRSILPRRRPPRRRRRALVHPLPLQIFQKSPPKSLVVRRAYWRSSRSPGEVRGLGQASARLPLLRQAASASPGCSRRQQPGAQHLPIFPQLGAVRFFILVNGRRAHTGLTWNNRYSGMTAGIASS